MKCVVRFFGPALDHVGKGDREFPIDGGTTLGSLAGQIAEKYPGVGAMFGVRLAVNRKYVALDHVLTDGDEVAVIPPVSGG